MTTEPLPSNVRPGQGSDLFRRLAMLFGSISRPLAGRRWFRLWGVLHHVGRTSGRAYATPIVARRVPGGFVIPMPFGERTQWVRNLQAADGATIRWDGRDFHVVDPRLVDLNEVAGSFNRIQVAIMRRAKSRFVHVADESATH